MPPKPTWRVTRTSDYESIGNEVAADLLKYGLSWFEYRSDLTRVLEWRRYTRSEGKGRYSKQEWVDAEAVIVFKMMLGRRSTAVADLKHLVKCGNRKTAMALAERLKISVEELAANTGNSPQSFIPMNEKPAPAGLRHAQSLLS